MNQKNPKAYITGASSGIGKEFALQLKNTHDLALVARNQSALDELAITIQSNNPHTKVETHSLDLTKKEDLDRLYSLIKKDTSLDLVINNAGFGTVGEFAEATLTEEMRQIQLNINALVELTHGSLKNLKAQGKGGIINVASLAGYLPAPYSAIYAATKAFVKSFTESIHEEAMQHGVVVQSLCPGLTHSDFHQRAGIDKNGFPKIMWMHADEVVKDSLNSLRKKEAVCIPGAVNQLAKGLTNIVPNSLTRKIAGNLMKQ